jgi:hypothetical protein
MAEKTVRKGQKQLQSYDGFNKLLRLEGLMVLVSGVSGKSQTKVATFEVERRGMRLTLTER